jgi:hypothetical protein
MCTISVSFASFRLCFIFSIISRHSIDISISIITCVYHCQRCRPLLKQIENESIRPAGSYEAKLPKVCPVTNPALPRTRTSLPSVKPGVKTSRRRITSSYSIATSSAHAHAAGLAIGASNCSSPAIRIFASPARTLTPAFQHGPPDHPTSLPPPPPSPARAGLAYPATSSSIGHNSQPVTVLVTRS